MHKSPKTVRIHEENEIIQVTKIGEESIIEDITNDEAKNTCIDTETDHIDAIEEEQLEDKFLEEREPNKKEMEPNVTKNGIEPAEVLLSVRSLENDTKNLKLSDDITVIETPIFNEIALKVDNLENKEIFENTDKKSANENYEENLPKENDETKIESNENQTENKDTENEKRMEDEDQNGASIPAYKNEHDLKIVDLESDTLCTIAPTADLIISSTDDAYYPMLEPAPYFGPPPVYKSPVENKDNFIFK